MNSLDLLVEVGSLCCQNKIIPFLGAGCSLPSLQLDWDTLMDEIAKEHNIDEEGNMNIAQRFINQHGKDAFCNILKNKLLIDEFDDEKGYVYIAILSMSIGIVYTTNQDNVFEKCCEKYGFKYKTIITLDDLVTAKIGEGLYIKYHGDCKFPDSVIFGEDEYLDRIDDSDNFIDIRLKADMLGKKILFIGYSFRDINLKLFFRRLKRVFGKIPESYMIVWSLDDDLERECWKYNIKIINPKEIFPLDSQPSAYSRTIDHWCDIVFQKKTTLAIDEFFNYKYSQRVISRYELNALSRLLGTIPTNEFIKKFRNKMDATIIPLDFETDVTRLFIRLACSCEGNDADALKNLMFNLKLTKKFNRFIETVYFFVACNFIEADRYRTIGYSTLNLSFLGEEFLILALATAFEILRKNNIMVSDFYRSGLTYSITDRSMNVNELSTDLRQYITYEFDYVWKQKFTTYEHPIQRQYRLLNNSPNPKHDTQLIYNMYATTHNKDSNPYYYIMGL